MVALRITAMTAFLVLFTLLPFFPGRYDALAAPLSRMALFLGTAGLVVVPIGALWLVAEHRGWRGRWALALGALIVSSLLWILVSVSTMLDHLTLGLAALALGALAVRRLLPRLKSPSTANPLYWIVVPLAVFLIQLALAEPATEFSRNRAMRNSAPLIADIERYRTANGRYPLSLVAVHPDYKPSVVGIREYRYEPRGDAYNLLFEQPSFRLGTTEIVVYNPRGEHAMTSHALDVLQLTPEQLALDQARGHYAVHDAGRPNWKYYWYD